MSSIAVDAIDCIDEGVHWREDQKAKEREQQRQR